MTADLPEQTDIPRGWRDALISVAALLLAFAALDDITTDTATSFTYEYIALVACAMWFAALGLRRMRLTR